MILNYREATYAEVFPLWKKLWDKHDFDSTSSMLFMGGYDPDIPKKYTPHFFAATLGERIVGVLSVHPSSEKHSRMRGLFVEPEYRQQGVALKLIELCIDCARRSGAELIWAAPRATSLDIFINLGFTQNTDFVSDGFTYGPNCYVSLKL